jgi:DNA-binding XRE family transcriptional regulator
MTGDEFKAVLRRLGRTQIGLAQEIGVSRRTVHLWAERGPPAYAIYLISLIERYAVPAKHEAPTERPLLDPAAVLGSMLAVAASDGMRQEFLSAVEYWLANHR